MNWTFYEQTAIWLSRLWLMVDPSHVFKRPTTEIECCAWATDTGWQSICSTSSSTSLYTDLWIGSTLRSKSATERVDGRPTSLFIFLSQKYGGSKYHVCPQLNFWFPRPCRRPIGQWRVASLWSQSGHRGHGEREPITSGIQGQSPWSEVRGRSPP